MRRRFFWALVLVALVTLIAGGFTAAVLINHSVEDSARSEFTRQAEATARLIEAAVRERGMMGQAPLRSLGSLLGIVEAVGGHDYVEAVLVRPAGAVTVVGDEAPLAEQIPGGAAALGQRAQFEAEVDGEPVAAFALPVQVGSLGKVVVIIGTDLELVPWPPVAVRLLWGLGLGVLLAAVAAGWLSRFLGRRLEGLSSASRSLAGGDLSARAPVEGKDEIAEVAVAFNEMAGELEEARRRERDFLVSVGHDLRTPLTTIAGYAEALHEGKVARRGPGPGGRRHAPRVGPAQPPSGGPDGALPPGGRRVHLAAGGGEPDGAPAGDGGGLPRAGPKPPGCAWRRTSPRCRRRRSTRTASTRWWATWWRTPCATRRPEGRCGCGLGPEGDRVRLAVADTGPGIEAADLPHIFERLYVAQRYRPARPEGSGLGLAIVHELVEAMGGTVEVVSAPGAGHHHLGPAAAAAPGGLVASRSVLPRGRG